jgi:hypothetical protein
MGGSFSKLFSLLWSKKEIRILILGLVGVHRLEFKFTILKVSRIMPERLLYCTDSR